MRQRAQIGAANFAHVDILLTVQPFGRGDYSS
jgi:hypothetical protein